MFAYSLLFNSILSFSLAVFILAKTRKEKLIRVWAGVSIGVSLWSFSLFKIVTSVSNDDTVFWNQILYIGAIFIPIFYYHFIVLLLGLYTKIKKFIYTNYVIGSLFLIVDLFFYHPLLFKEAKSRYGLDYWFSANVGFVYYLFFFFFVCLVVLSFFHIFRNYRYLRGHKKNQVKYVFYAGLIGFGGGVTAFMPQLARIYPFGVYFILIYVVFISYAITRHRLMDISLVIVRSIAFGFIVLLITGLFAALSASVGRFLETFIGTKSDLVVGLVVAFLVVTAYAPLKKAIERATNKFLFKKTYDPDQLIASVSDISTSILDFKKMLTMIAKALEVSMHPQKIAFTLLDKKDRLLVTYEQGFGKPIYDLTKGKEKVLPTYFKDSREIYVIEELKTAYEQGEYQPKNIKLMYALYEMDVALVVPLFAKEKLIGLIVLGNKKSGDLYNKQDLRVLDIIASQSAVGIENAALYEEQRLFGVKLEKTVKDRTAQLRSANKKLTNLDEAKSEFISIASHQLRTPLTIIKGYISMILEGSFGKTSKVIKDNLTKVYASNERLIGLVEDLLNISRIESGKQEYTFKPLNIVEHAQVVFEELVLRAKERGLQLIFNKPKKKLANIVADADKLHEVMINFVDNSVKYTKKGKAEINITQEGDEIIFAIKDTGIGMNDDDKDHLFKKFSRAEGTFLIHTEGTGLGLYVAKMIVQSHGGRIWADSDGRGKGSTFSFAIPIEGKGQKVGTIKQERIKSLDVKKEMEKSEMMKK